jgi:hypothetical protein
MPSPTNNTIPCGKCAHFDASMALRAGKPTQLGWCAKLSKYPSTDKPGRDARRGVSRVGEGQLPKPVVKTRVQVEMGCVHATALVAQKPVTKADLLRKATGGR